MIELVDMCIEMQKRVIDAHEKSIDAARANLGAANAAVVVQQAMNDATKANLSAWRSWMDMWGWRK